MTVPNPDWFDKVKRTKKGEQFPPIAHPDDTPPAQSLAEQVLRFMMPKK